MGVHFRSLSPEGDGGGQNVPLERRCPLAYAPGSEKDVTKARPLGRRAEHAFLFGFGWPPLTFRNERQQIEDGIVVLERLARGRGQRRGRPPKWMTEVKRGGRPPGSKNKPKE
jgi:hypothetical protein